MAAELYPLLKKKPELYLSARIYTLASHLIIRSCFPGLFLGIMNSETWFNPVVLQVWGIINLAVSVPYLIWYILKMRQNNYAKPLVKLYKTA